jgi:localization factor PodJL
MLDNARILANTAAEEKTQHEKSASRSTLLTLVGAAAIVVVGLAIGLVSVGGTVRATRTSFATASETLANASGVTIINATGAAVVDQMTPSTRAMTARAEKGDAVAQAELAMAYLRGDGVVSNPVAAAGWAGLAATKGQPLGQFILGTLYNDGIKPDPRFGFRWMSAAALNGNVKAMHNVAVAFLSGSGTEKDPREAANWFNKAASMGYRDSAFDLAVLYERGEGVGQSTQRALYWYDNAAAAGDKEAAQRASLLRFGVPGIAGNLDMSKRNRVSRLQ